jgi:peptide/nickel transport system permease protein
MLRIVPRVSREVAQLLLVLVSISTVLFVLLRLAGDPVVLLLPPEASAEDIARLRRDLGLDAPLFQQYLLFLFGMARLDFGESLVFRQPALSIAASRVPATLELTAAAVAFGALAGVPLGILSATSRRSAFRAMADIFAVAGQSMPSYWLGVLLVVMFAVTIRLFPASGRGGMESLVLPGVTLGAFLAGRIVRLIKSGIEREAHAEYVRTAHGKGLSSRRVLLGHIAPNALIPIVVVIGVDVGRLMGGAVITETIFAWPGIGRQMVTAMLLRDYPVAQAIVFLVAIFVYVTNRATDLIVTMLDPRIRAA